MKKVIVSERALLARINRVLAKKDQAVHRARENSRMFNNCGRYYHLDHSRNTVIDFKFGLKRFANDLGVLAEYEDFEPA